MNLEHFVVPESKKVSKKGRLVRHRCQPERTADGQSWNNLSKKINKITHRIKSISIFSC